MDLNHILTRLHVAYRHNVLDYNSTYRGRVRAFRKDKIAKYQGNHQLAIL